MATLIQNAWETKREKLGKPMIERRMDAGDRSIVRRPSAERVLDARTLGGVFNRHARPPHPYSTIATTVF